MRLFFKKCHAHKPKKGKGSYRRYPDGLTPELVELAQKMEDAANENDKMSLEEFRKRYLEDEELADSIKRDQDEEQQRD